MIVAFGPDLRPYGKLFTDNLGPDPLTSGTLDLSPSLLQLARDMSGAGPGDVYYKAHLKYIYGLTNTLRGGASIVCGGVIGQSLRKTASSYPEDLFSTLDADLQAYAREAQNAHIGVVVPPGVGRQTVLDH